jgi:hypothetical protein
MTSFTPPGRFRFPTRSSHEEQRHTSAKSGTTIVREGEFVAEVHVTFIESEGPWTQSLSVEDASRLDDVRAALRAGDVKRASRLASRIYRVMPARP